MEKVNVPEGSKGPWKVERFTISEDEASFANMRAAFSLKTTEGYDHPRIKHLRRVVGIEKATSR